MPSLPSAPVLESGTSTSKASSSAGGKAHPCPGNRCGGHPLTLATVELARGSPATMDSQTEKPIVVDHRRCRRDRHRARPRARARLHGGRPRSRLQRGGGRLHRDRPDLGRFGRACAAANSASATAAASPASCISPPISISPARTIRSTRRSTSRARAACCAPCRTSRSASSSTRAPCWCTRRASPASASTSRRRSRRNGPIRESKAAAEAVIREEHGEIPYVLLHLAGLYDDRTAVPTLAQQIARIYERDLQEPPLCRRPRASARRSSTRTT